MDDWSSYLADFHATRPGIADEVLSRCVSGHHTPYRWLARGVSSSARTVLDLDCGSGLLGAELARPGRTVVGVDPTMAELAGARGEGPYLQADPLRLPFADGVFDVVVSTLGLAQVHPTGAMLDEVARLLRPGGVFVGLVPTVRPLNGKDVRVAGQLTRILMSSPQFPGKVELGAGKLLEAHGLRKGEDARERYRFTVRSRADAELLLRAFYLPGIEQARIERAVDWLARRAERRGEVQVPIPLRRLVAIRPGSR